MQSAKARRIMPLTSHASTSSDSPSTSYPSFSNGSTSARRPETGRAYTQGLDIGRTSTGGPSTSRTSHGRPKTATSTAGGSRDQQVICAISESRGISPIVGLAFVNFTTSEAIMCQISDNQTFVRTMHKLNVFQPTEILFMTTAAQPKSNLYSTVENNQPILPHTRLVVIDRKYWSETTGIEYIEQLAFKQDVEAIKVSVGGNFYAICCISAVCAHELLGFLSFFRLNIS